VISSRAAARIAHTIVDLERFERWKGLTFVALTSAAFLAAAHVARRRSARQQELLERQREALARADGRVLAGTLAGAIAHDIRNVLTVAGLGLDLVVDRDELPRGARPTADLRVAFHHLSDLSQRLLALSRSAHEPALARIELAGLVRETLDFVRLHPVLTEAHVSTALEPNLLVTGDRALLGRLLVNLVLNAAEAGEGARRIEVRCRRAGEEIHLEVHDDGPGVDPARRATLFDALHSTKPTGTGLGLFSVRYTAELLDGRVELDDSPLGGALFRIVLPAPGARPAA
jgi:signal transduction histidine kinase